MKHFPFKRQFLFAAVALLLVLSACVMPFPGGDETPSGVVPTAETIIIPTAPPVIEPTAVPETTTETETGETAAEETTTEESSESADTAEETTAETPAETPTDTEETAANPTGETTHVVKSGETLGHISQQYDVSVADIAAANNITDLDSLEVGQTLIIKSGAAADSGGEETTTDESGELVHIVQAGDNLFRIGLRYGFTAEELAAYNNIPDVTQIDVGQIIKIPPK